MEVRVTGVPWAAGLVIWAGVFPACQGSGPGSTITASDTMFIGVAARRPVPNQAAGLATESYFNGVHLAVEHLNEQLSGQDGVFAVAMPPLAQPTQVAVAAAFQRNPRVVGVVGHTGSAQTLEAAPVYGDVEGGERHAVVAVSPTATNPIVTAASRWVFRVCPTDHDAARALALYTVDAAAIRRVAIIYRNDLFGRGFRRTFHDAFEAVGGEIVEEDPYVQDETDFAPYIRRIARHGVDGLVLGGGSASVLEILALLQAHGVDIPVLGSDDLAVLANNPEARRSAANIRYVTFYLPERGTTPENRRFRQNYRARFGMSPDHVAALAYDAAMLIGSAALEVGPDRHRIRDWIAARGQTEPVFAGATGPIQFNHQGDVVEKPVLIAEVGR